MPNSTDYRKYLEEKFEGMQKLQHAYFREVHDRFDVIEKQNDKRNGRLDKAETEIKSLSRYIYIGLGICIILQPIIIYVITKLSDV